MNIRRMVGVLWFFDALGLIMIAGLYGGWARLGQWPPRYLDLGYAVSWALGLYLILSTFIKKDGGVGV